MKITIYKNGAAILQKEVEGNSTTLQDLGFVPDFSNYNYLVVNTETELTSETSIIQNVELVGADGVLINVTPKDSKAGSSRSELYEVVKRILASRPELKSVVGNYTQKPSVFLQEFVDQYSTPVRLETVRAGNTTPNIEGCINALIEMADELTYEQKRRIAKALAPYLYLTIAELRR